MAKSPHIPVLCDGVMAQLDIQPTDCVVDGTIGFGGHSALFLDALGPEGRLCGCDRDREALDFCRDRFQNDKRLHLHHGSFSDLPDWLSSIGISRIDKMLLDLGFSSFQLDHPDRGFSFGKDMPLDMRMDTSQPLRADVLLNTWSKEDLIDLFREYGDLYRCEKFVDKIIERRQTAPLSTTFELVELIKKGFFFRNRRSVYIRTCSQVFQALRIVVNREFDEIDSIIHGISSLMGPGSRLGIITFHSGEDRLVKRLFAKLEGTRSTHKKVIKPSQAEIRRNSRSKSAKLRVIEWL